jgi:hypothetical protein
MRHHDFFDDPWGWTEAAAPREEPTLPPNNHPCLCRHEDCGEPFVHHGGPTETTVCPSCGRQQMTQLVTGA